MFAFKNKVVLYRIFVVKYTVSNKKDRLYLNKTIYSDILLIVILQLQTGNFILRQVLALVGFRKGRLRYNN